MSKLLITPLQVKGISCVAVALEAEGHILELQLQPAKSTALVGNIYLANVENIAGHIQSAFVQITEEQTCYFSLKEEEQLLFGNQNRKAPLRPGDDIIVQVSREAMKGKIPSVTANLNFTGKYLVLTTGKRELGISAKILGEDRARLKKWLEAEVGEDFGLVVRTNAKEASKEALFAELSYLKKRWAQVLQKGHTRTTRTLLEGAEPFYLSAIRDVYQENLEEIVVEGAELFGQVEAYLTDYQPELLPRLRQYQDSLLPLYKLYALEKAMIQATQEKVWLKSGGFLVIQQTEAFVSIDVNSGKYTAKKKPEETVRKINKEAAAEIARQIRLRNLSGIILIDFINMQSEDHREELLHVLQKLVKSDPVRTTVVDMTRLHIVEMTRHKVRRPLAEDLAAITG